MKRYARVFITLVLSLTTPLVVCTNGNRAPKVLDIVSIGNQDVQHQAYEWMTKEINQGSTGLQLRHHAATLMTREVEAIDAVQSGNIAMSDPGGSGPLLIPNYFRLSDTIG